MNSFTDFATTVIELPKVTLAGIGLGSSIAKVASHYIIDAGKEMYIKHESSNSNQDQLLPCTSPLVLPSQEKIKA